MQTSFYTSEELRQIGFKSVGDNVLISRKTSIYSPNQISIGSNVRIDDFSIFSGNINLGSNIHIAAYVALYGKNGIVLEDYTGISARTTVYSAMDDFSGEYLIGPIHEKDKILVSGGVVTMKKFSQIGAHCVVFPNLTIGEGTVIGACSMVRHSTESWGIYYGIPARKYKERSKGLLCKIEVKK
jgi:galactoside O-acetyltransferase